MKAAKRPKIRSKRALIVAEASKARLWPYAAAMLAAAILAFFIYGPALSGPFLLDDSYLPYQVPEFANASLRAWVQGVRPVLMLSFWLNFIQDRSNSPGPYHVVNVLLHIMTGGLIFLIVRKVLKVYGAAAEQIDIFAGFAAALFLLHPLQTESVSYIASRSETLSVFFFMTAFTVFLYRKSVATSWPVAATVLILFGAACLTKEHAAVLPALLLLTDYYWNPGFSWQGVKRNWKIYLPMAAGAVLAGAFVWRVLKAATSAGFGMKDLTWYQYFFTECRAIWRYILFYIVPVGQNIDHDFPVSKSILDHGAVFGLLGLIALIVAAWIYRRRFPLISYGVFTFLILLAPTSSVVPIKDTLIERRMYLPFLGLLLVTVGLLQFWRTTRPALIGTLLLILLISAGLTYRRNLLWGSTIDIWSDSVSKSPNKARPNFQLAYGYYVAGKCAEALTLYVKTAKLQEPDASLYVDWGLAADCVGNGPEALDKLQKAAELIPTAHTWSQVGMEYAKLGQYPQALDALEKSLKLDPNFERTYVYRGNVYALQGNKAQAIADYEHALQIDPTDSSARENMLKIAR